MTLRFNFWPVLLFITLILGCGGGGNNDDSIDLSQVLSITYEFSDASVSPEYHRSYVISITTDTVRIVVDSYGKVLADQISWISMDQFKSIRNSLKTYDIRNCSLDDSSACSGGTTEQISYSDAENELFYGSVYHCGGRNFGNLCGDLDGFTRRLKRMVPNLEDLLQTFSHGVLL